MKDFALFLVIIPLKGARSLALHGIALRNWQKLIFTSLVGSFLTTGTTFAGRPLLIDDAAPVALDHLELELGFSQSRPQDEGRDQSWPVTNLTYGLLDGLEIGLGIQRINQDPKGSSSTSGFQDLHLAAKYRFWHEDRLFPALALSFDLRLPTANRRKGLSPGRTDETFLLIGTKTWPRWRST
jgi:hypothetical protein